MIYYLVVNKEERTVDNKTFPIWYGFRQHKDEKGYYQDDLTPSTDKDGKPIMVARSIKVVPTKNAIEELDKLGYPCRLTLDTSETFNDRATFQVDIDKKKDGTIKFDKNGRKHAVIYIRHANGYKIERKMTMEDIDNLN